MAEVPFPGHAGVVSTFPQRCRKRDDPVVQMGFMTRFALLVLREELGHVAQCGGECHKE